MWQWMVPCGWALAVSVNDNRLSLYESRGISKALMVVSAMKLVPLPGLPVLVRHVRASMVEVMDSPYIRTAIIKGMPYRRVVVRHAIRNALMAPITIIMLHVNWLVGGVVVV